MKKLYYTDNGNSDRLEGGNKWGVCVFGRLHIHTWMLCGWAKSCKKVETLLCIFQSSIIWLIELETTLIVSKDVVLRRFYFYNMLFLCRPLFVCWPPHVLLLPFWSFFLGYEHSPIVGNPFCKCGPCSSLRAGLVVKDGRCLNVHFRSFPCF